MVFVKKRWVWIPICFNATSHENNHLLSIYQLIRLNVHSCRSFMFAFVVYTLFCSTTRPIVKLTSWMLILFLKVELHCSCQIKVELWRAMLHAQNQLYCFRKKVQYLPWGKSLIPNSPRAPRPPSPPPFSLAAVTLAFAVRRRRHRRVLLKLGLAGPRADSGGAPDWVPSLWQQGRTVCTLNEVQQEVGPRCKHPCLFD